MEQSIEVDEQEAVAYSSDNEPGTAGFAADSSGSGLQSDKSQ